MPIQQYLQRALALSSHSSLQTKPPGLVGAVLALLCTIGLVVTMGLLTVARGYAEEKGHATECGLATLTGSYVFSATGYNIVSSVPQPKAIVEVIDFDGKGTLNVPAATVSINGNPILRSMNVGGSYTIPNQTSTTKAVPAPSRLITDQPLTSLSCPMARSFT